MDLRYKDLKISSYSPHFSFLPADKGLLDARAPAREGDLPATRHHFSSRSTRLLHPSQAPLSQRLPRSSQHRPRSPPNLTSTGHRSDQYWLLS